MLAAGNVQHIYDFKSANSWPEGKDGATKRNAPFGQLPLLFHRNQVIGQSITVARYCARLGGLMPEDPMELAKVEMIIDHTCDIFNGLVIVHQTQSSLKKATWANAESTTLPAQLKFLKLLLNDKKFFGGDKVNAADVAVFSTLEVLSAAGCGNVIEGFPELLVIRDEVMKTGCITTMERFDPYIRK